MKKVIGLALAGAFLVACGHATPTGSASNNYATPTGQATATNPRYLNPDVNPPQKPSPSEQANTGMGEPNAPPAPPPSPEETSPPPPPAPPLSPEETSPPPATPTPTP
jgi:hypothetical protein